MTKMLPLSSYEQPNSSGFLPGLLTRVASMKIKRPKKGRSTHRHKYKKTLNSNEYDGSGLLQQYSFSPIHKCNSPKYDEADDLSKVFYTSDHMHSFAINPSEHF